MDPAFRYPHWAGLRGCTNPYGVAAPCVFSKQSPPPRHCDLRWQLRTTTAGTPSTEDTGPICRFPSAGVFRHALACSARAPVSVLGTVLPPSFSRAPGVGRLAPSRLHPLLSITELRGLRRLDTLAAGARPTPKRRTPLNAGNTPLRGCRAGGAGILTGFPFRRRRVTCRLRTG